MLTFPDPRTFDLADRWRFLRESNTALSSDKRDEFYRGSYRFILPHFATCTFDGSTNDYERFWRGLILVYSWMGRGILTDFSDTFDRYSNACDIIKSACVTGDISLESLNVLVALCNGSTIATSKVLHFLKPEAFAIWDSRVCAAIFDGKAHHYSLRDPDSLLAYFKWIRRVHLDIGTERTVVKHLKIDEQKGSLRAKEFILFMSGVGVNRLRHV
jgi:hypothetical protein